MKQQKGFTLIELIIVIIILGILAVTAAPRFFNFAEDARKSAVQGLAGGIQGAYQTVYARAAIDGELGDTGKVAGIDLVYGYPDSTSTGIRLAANLSPSEWYIVQNDETPPTSVAITLLSLVEGSPDYAAVQDSNCRVVYNNATNADTPPVVNIDVSGCSESITVPAPAPAP